MTQIRGKNTETAFNEWYKENGHIMRDIIENREGGNYKRTYELMKAGFTWGWIKRAERDRKLKKEKIV